MKRANKSVLLTAATTTASVFGFASLTEQASAASIHTEDFDANDGGYIASLFDPLAATGAGAAGPWVVGANGVGGSNAWSATGGEGSSAPFELHLTSPVINVPGDGPVLVEFDHQTVLEPDWDGGVIMTSVNGAPFVQLTSFTMNGYNDTMQDTNDLGFDGDLNGLEMFSGVSGGFIHSVGEVGTLNAGDTLQIQFRGAWDWGFVQGGGQPEWIVDNVNVSQTPIPEPSSTLLVGIAGLGLLLRRRKG
jgi:hypothetical protein